MTDRQILEYLVLVTYTGMAVVWGGLISNVRVRSNRGRILLVVALLAGIFWFASIFFWLMPLPK